MSWQSKDYDILDQLDLSILAAVGAGNKFDWRRQILGPIFGAEFASIFISQFGGGLPVVFLYDQLNWRAEEVRHTDSR